MNYIGKEVLKAQVGCPGLQNFEPFFNSTIKIKILILNLYLLICL